MSIGIDKYTGRVYEGSQSEPRELNPQPILFPCLFFKNRVEITGGDPDIDTFGPKHLFQQEYFDSKSRIRTGYAYRRNGTQPLRQIIGGFTRNHSGYSRFSLWSEYLRDGDGKLYVVFGDATRFTVWTLVDIEVVFSGAELITLKALSTFGVLPEILESEIPAESLSRIKSTLKNLVDEIYVASADSVIDHCREAATAILSAYLGVSGRDLGELIKSLEKMDGNDAKSLIVATPAIINRLHPRRKTSEVQRRGLRPVSDEDAQLAVSCLGTLLLETGYARW